MDNVKTGKIMIQFSDTHLELWDNINKIIGYHDHLKVASVCNS